MFAKLVVLILGVSVTACGLLAARQVRTQAAHELAQSRLRVMHLDNARSKLRAEIASLVTPEHVQEMASRITPLKPIAGEFPAPILPTYAAAAPPDHAHPQGAPR
jgi:hypothetical protein